jgi:Domain of unknown function (DUF4129)
MPAPTFEKTNLPWQLRQMQQQGGEWLEQKLSEIKLPKLPRLNAPEGSTFDPSFLLGLFWLVVAGLLLWLGWRLWPRLWAIWQQWQRTTAPAADDPAPWRQQSATGWAQAAEAFGRQANYGEACRALYFAMLQRLNETQMVPYTDSRTDGEYLISLLAPRSAAPPPSFQTAQSPTGQTATLQTATLQPSAVQSCQVLLQVHEQVCFGPGSVSAETFDRCAQAYQTFDASARSVTPTAARSEAQP